MNFIDELGEALRRMFLPENFINGTSIRNSVLIVFLLIVAMIFIGRKFKKQDILKVPKGLLLLAEMLVSWINSMCKESLGKRWKKYAPFILTLAIFIFVSNILGIFGLLSPTANVIITITLGLITGFIIQLTCITTQGFGKWIKGFFEPTPLLLPLNIISELVTPFSLGLRLFGNILSGGIILGLVHFVTNDMCNAIVDMIRDVSFGQSHVLGAIITVVVAPLLHAVFDLFFGAIQTYVFILLSTVFISSKLPEEDI